MNKNAFKRFPALYRALLALRQFGGRAWMRAAHAKGISEKKVFFSSFKGRAYSDSPRFISEALHALRPDLEIVWQLERAEDAPAYVRTVKPHTLSALSEIATARCIVDNFNRPIYMLKFSDQLYMQVWHGDRGFKKALYDMPNPIAYPDGEQMDLAIAASRHAENFYRTAFRYSGEILSVGVPRNDRLVKREDPAPIRARLGIPGDARVLLYAPTFRNATSGAMQRAGFDLSKARQALFEGTGTPWLILTRAHDKNRGIEAPDPDVRDMTDYPEMSDLMLISDMLITDYSSSAGDFPLLGRPVILYQPDLDDFESTDRSFYFDPRQTPFLRAESEAELLNLLRRADDLPDVSQAILDFFGTTESGASAEAAAAWISDRIPL